MRDAFNRGEILEENCKDGQETWFTSSVSAEIHTDSPPGRDRPVFPPEKRRRSRCYLL